MAQDLRALGETPSIQLFRLIVTLGLRLRGLMDQRLAAIGVTTQQAVVLTIVSHAESPPTLGSLATSLGCSHQNVRQLIDVLVKKKLVRVKVNPVDRRIRTVEATKAVAKLFLPRDTEDHAQVREWLRALSDGELTVAVGLLLRVLASLPDA